ncbi:unnamed protein product [Amoebophrya sp. A25]|nr:unnamed protein product [Amoebophrya sp. A25]|eukprot:GSA25T00016992001.1
MTLFSDLVHHVHGVLAQDQLTRDKTSFLALFPRTTVGTKPTGGLEAFDHQHTTPTSFAAKKKNRRNHTNIKVVKDKLLAKDNKVTEDDSEDFIPSTNNDVDDPPPEEDEEGGLFDPDAPKNDPLEEQIVAEGGEIKDLDEMEAGVSESERDFEEMINGADSGGGGGSSSSTGKKNKKNGSFLEQLAGPGRRSTAFKDKGKKRQGNKAKMSSSSSNPTPDDPEKALRDAEHSILKNYEEHGPQRAARDSLQSNVRDVRAYQTTRHPGAASQSLIYPHPPPGEDETTQEVLANEGYSELLDQQQLEEDMKFDEETNGKFPE